MIKRDIYLQKLINFKDKQLIKVITGIRRCGKSVILLQIIDELKKKILMRNKLYILILSQRSIPI